MQPILLEEYFNPEKKMEQMRSLFREADKDFSGFLSINEFH